MRTSPLLPLVLLASCATSGFGGTADRAAMQRSPSYSAQAGVFVNESPEAALRLRDVGDVIRRYRENDQRPPGPIPLALPDRAHYDEPPPGEVRLTWVGHSTLLVELGGFRVLTDPVWSDRVSPVPFAGPQRFHPPGITWDDLPDVDAVIISHDHYDHLDQETIQRLGWRNARFFVPLGVGAHLRRWGVQQVRELDWWERATLTRAGESVELIATPARHFSGRGPFDRNETLWASWVIRSEAGAVYFGGDTGYFDGFREIGARFGPFVATLMPIGAYDVAWADIHLTPEQAVQAHLDLGNTGMFVPIHYATFSLAPHPWAEPLERSLAAVDGADVRSYAFPLPGQPFIASDHPLRQAWWRALGR